MRLQRLGWRWLALSTKSAKTRWLALNRLEALSTSSLRLQGLGQEAVDVASRLLDETLCARKAWLIARGLRWNWRELSWSTRIGERTGTRSASKCRLHELSRLTGWERVDALRLEAGDLGLLKLGLLKLRLLLMVLKGILLLKTRLVDFTQTLAWGCRLALKDASDLRRERRRCKSALLS